MKKLKAQLFFALVFALSTSASAEWDGGLEGGSVIRDSGTATLLRLKLFNNDRPLSHYIYADWTRGGDGNNGYEIGYKPRYWFGDSLYSFGDVRFRTEETFGIDNEQLFLAGVGNQFINTDSQQLWAEVGAGQRNTEFDNGTDSSDTLAVARAGFSQKLADLVRLELNAKTYRGDTATESDLEAGVSLRVSGGSIKYVYAIRRLKPENGDAIEDDHSYVTFSYNF